MFSWIYIIIIGLTFFYAVRNKRAGVFLLVGLLPFYTIFREMTGGEPLFFVWPYLIMGLYMIHCVIDELNINRDVDKYKKILKTFNLVILPIYYILLFASTEGVGVLINGHVRSFAALLTDTFIILALLPILAFIVQYFVFYYIAKLRTEGSITLPDIFVTLFVCYGLAHVLIAFIDGRSLFNALIQFRYYFSMGFLYFIIRHWFTSFSDMYNLAKIGVFVFLVAFLFTYIEAALLNCFKIPPSSMPWSGVLYELFEYAPNDGKYKVFIEASYSPLGIMYSQHLTGLLLVIGFALYYPSFITKFNIKKPNSSFFLLLLVLILPIGLLFTSKTVIILYVSAIFLTTILLYREWKKAIPISLLFLTVLPIFYSNYLLPCMKHDIGREFSYLVAAATPVKEASEIDPDKLNSKNIGSNKKGVLSCIYCDAKTNQRVLNNAFIGLGSAVLVDVKDIAKTNTNLYSIIYGKGYSLSDWTKSLKEPGDSDSFQEVSHSDTPYLKMYQQFGLMGILLFFAMTVSIVWISFQLWWVHNKRSPFVIGLIIVTPMAMLATFHLQIYFKTGLNSILFIAMAFCTTLYMNAIKDLNYRSFWAKLYHIAVNYVSFCIRGRSFGCLIEPMRILINNQFRQAPVVDLLASEIDVMNSVKGHDIFKNPKHKISELKFDGAFNVELSGKKETLSFPIDWKKSYDDTESLFALNRFGWLLSYAASRKISSSEIKKIILHWIDKNPKDVNVPGWDIYSISERLCNWSVLLREVIPNEDSTEMDHIIKSMYFQLNILSTRIEFRGASTNNHLINNGRALYIAGLTLNNDYYSALGRKLLVFGLDTMFSSAGMLREGSSHYQILMARTYLEVLWYSLIFKDECFNKKILSKTEKIYDSSLVLLNVEPFPYIGDMSPDYTIDFHKEIKNVGSSIITGEVNETVNIKYDGWGYYFGGGITEVNPNGDKVEINECYSDIGFYIVNTENISFVAYVNPLAFVPPWSHGHSDLGSFILNVNGKEVFASTGRLTYNAKLGGDVGRSIKSHNGISIDGEEPTLVHGLNGFPEILSQDIFNSPPQVSINDVNGNVEFEVIYSAYSRLFVPVKLSRKFTIGSDKLIIEDSMEGSGKHKIETFFHLPSTLLMSKSKKISEVTFIDSDTLKVLMNVSSNLDNTKIKSSVCSRAISYGKDENLTKLTIKQEGKLPVSNRYEISLSEVCD